MKTTRTKGFLAASAILGGLIVYQNCSPMQAAHIGADSSVSAKDIPDARVMLADLAWSMRGGEPELNRFGRAQRWGDIKKKGVNLYPPLIPNSQTLNLDNSGSLVTVDGFDYLHFDPDASMAPAVSDLSEMTFDHISLLLFVRDLTLPAVATDGSLRLFGLYPANGDSAGILVIDAAPGANGTVDLWAIDWFDGTNFARKRMTLTSDEAKGPLAIAVRFDKESTTLQIAVNGRLSDAVVENNGRVPALGLVARSFELHAKAASYGMKGSFNLGDFAFYFDGLNDDTLVASTRDLVNGRSGGVPIAVAPTPAPTPVATPAPPGPSAGADLYRVNCQGCHGPLATSAKHGKSLAQVNGAIGSVTAMSSLSGLSAADRQAIVDALSK